MLSSIGESRPSPGERYYYEAAKRGFDLVFVTLALPVWIPLLLIVAVMVRIFLGSPVFFRHKRPGLHGRIFQILKFRTMRNDRDSMGNLLSDSERLTRLGRWLRSTSLDELPELVNVLRGDMSLVGPRPLLIRYLDRYTEQQAHRHDVKPGITGWAQVQGRNAISWDEKLRLDLWYVANRSFWLDLNILLRTLAAVLFRQGISAPGDATMPEFFGTSPQPEKHERGKPHERPALPAQTDHCE